MSTQATNRDQKTEQEQGFCTIDHVSLQLHALEKFMARRFDEISMEINATAQQMDMNESDMSQRFSQVLESLSVISFSGTGESAANSGVELEAVIKDTKAAAMKIMDAAEQISNCLMSKADLEKSRDIISKQVEEIFVACSFQDLAGQRIRNTLNTLHEIEQNIGGAIENLGIAIHTDEHVIQEKVQKGSSQGDIDAIFSN